MSFADFVKEYKKFLTISYCCKISLAAKDVTYRKHSPVSGSESFELFLLFMLSTDVLTEAACRRCKLYLCKSTRALQRLIFQ